jgi:hypothetical protein
MPAPRVFANSIPKSGTHLLRRCLSLFPMLSDPGIHLDLETGVAETDQRLGEAEPGQIVTGHLPYRHRFDEMLGGYGYRQLLMIRDPRDVVVSFSKYVVDFTKHRLHELFCQMPSDEERYMATIRGYADERAGYLLWDIGQLYRMFLRWLETGEVFTVKFESLIGNLGGGTHEAQVAEIQAIAGYIGVQLTEMEMEVISQDVFDFNSPTFRKGMIGDWRNHLTQDHLHALEQEMGDLMRDLGYQE